MVIRFAANGWIGRQALGAAPYRIRITSTAKSPEG